jgi:DNA-binding MarR family transcriptional regulator
VPAPVSLDTNVLYLAGELTHVLHSALSATFRKNKIGVTVEQFSILAILFYQDGINQQELGSRLKRNKTTITRVISLMERNKLIVRATDKADSRGKLIFLTKKGKTIQMKAITHAGAMYMKAVAGLDERSVKKTAEVLNKAIRNIA